ncbi:MAG: deoxyuridine 5'-triphosphate nucleotidohydrolase, partial [Solobacterium sp.]|nr:deoxyuridine 5'-triphosphate nucleotidohydrolase [Solobacterium sp.]
MNRIAEFEKVSLEQFKEDWQKSVGEESAEEVYEGLKLPLRATAGSAGYDFFAPVDIEIAPEEEVIIATGIRVKMEPGW